MVDPLEPSLTAICVICEREFIKTEIGATLVGLYYAARWSDWPHGWRCPEHRRGLGVADGIRAFQAVADRIRAFQVVADSMEEK